MLAGLPGDPEPEIGRGRTPSLRILQFIHTLQQQGPFIHTDRPTITVRVEGWVYQGLPTFISQTKRLCRHFTCTRSGGRIVEREAWGDTNSCCKVREYNSFPCCQHTKTGPLPACTLVQTTNCSLSQLELSLQVCVIFCNRGLSH